MAGRLFLLAATGWGAEPASRIENHSYPTLCSEVDNINIPVYGSGVTAYRVTATHPEYGPAPIREWGADWDDCTGSDRIWFLGTADGRSDEFRGVGAVETDEFFAPDEPAAGVEEPVSEFPGEIFGGISEQRIRFTADEAGDANIEVRIGSKLTLGLAEVSGSLEIRVFTFGRAGWLDQGSRVFDNATLVRSWDIPDLTWQEGPDANTLRIVAAPADGASTEVPRARYDYLELRKRDQAGDNSAKPTVLYADSDTRVETVFIDFWWRHPETMAVRVAGGGTDPAAHYVRIRRRMPFSKDWNEIFVLYQDGNARLLPLPPVWRKAIPHGASILLGSSSDDVRPVATLKEVCVDPVDLGLDLTYTDGSTAHVEMRADREANVLDVTGLTQGPSTNALTRLRSMWVCDGKSDLDRVRTESGAYPILDLWKTLPGTWWQFYRETPSYHNTDCPDVRIEILDASAARLEREAESFQDLLGGVVVAETAARGGAAVAFGAAGGFASYRFRLEETLEDAAVRLRFADAGAGSVEQPGNEMLVTLAPAVTGRTHTVCTGGTGAFETTPSVRLGRLEAGDHVLRIAVGPGPDGAVLDGWELVSQPVREWDRKPLATMQGEEATGTIHGQRIETPSAIGGAALRLGPAAEVSSAAYSIEQPEEHVNLYLRARYANEAGPCRVTVSVEGERRLIFPAESTGGGFRDTYELFLGAMQAGPRTLRFDLEPGTGCVDLDAFEIYERTPPPPPDPAMADFADRVGWDSPAQP
jgi:hypothetical protein